MRERRVPRWTAWAWLALLALGLGALVYCEKKGTLDAGLSPGDDVVLVKTLKSPSETVPSGGEVEVTVTVVDVHGRPVANREVTFSATLGTVPSSAVTDENGMAVVLFQGGPVVGTSVVTARVGENKRSIQLRIMDIPAGGVIGRYRYVLSSDVESMLANGMDRAEIRATVTDLDGRPKEGVRVTFSTTAGTLSPSMGVTDAEGMAQSTLVSSASSTDLVAQVTATLDTSSVGKGVPRSPAPSTLRKGAKAQGSTGAGAVRSPTSSGLLLSRHSALHTPDYTDEPDGMFVRLVPSVVPPSAVRHPQTGRVGKEAVSSGAPLSITFRGVSVWVEAGREAVPADGISVIPLRVMVKETTSSAAVVGAEVRLGSTLGSIAKEAITDETGVARDSLASATMPGTAVVTALYGPSLSATVSVRFTALMMRLSATPSSIFADGKSTSEIVAVLTDSLTNNPIIGVPVTFRTTRGTIRSEERTDSGGQVRVPLISSTTPGDAVVMASFGPALQQQVMVRFASLGMVLQVEEGRLLADGFSSIRVNAELRDEAGRPVEGHVVKFEADGGTVDPSAETDGRGMATVVFRSPMEKEDRRIEIRARAAAPLTELSDTVYVDLVGVTMALQIAPGLAAADAAAQVRVTAVLRETTRGVGVPSRTIAFKTNLGTLSAAEGITNGEGATSVMLTSSRTPGTATVTASYGMVLEAVGTVEFVEVSPAAVVLRSEPSSVLADGVSQATISASVRSADQHPVLDGTEVRFRILPGGSGSITPSAQTTDGLATALLTSGVVPGSVQVEAQVGAVRDTVIVVYEHASLVLRADPAVVQANGESEARVVALLRDADNNPIIGAAIHFAATLGTIPTSMATDQDGRASVVLRSDRSNGTVVVTARYGGLVDSTVVLLSGVVLEMRAHPEHLIADGEAGSVVTVSLKDAAGTPISGETVRLWTDPMDLGTLDRLVGITDVYGTVTATLTSAVDTVVTVWAEGAGAVGSVEVAFTKYLFSVLAEPSGLVANGATTLRATLLDRDRAPVEGVPVTFSTTLGWIEGSGGATDASGHAAVTLRSTQAGTALVTAAAEIEGAVVSSTVEVSISSALPSSMLLQVDPAIIAVDGAAAEVTVIVTDEGGNPVSNALVSFTFDGARGGARLDPGTATTDINGVAKTVFHSGSLASRQFEDVSIEARIGEAGITSNRVSLTISGAPATLTVGYKPEAFDNGDGTLELSIAALVADINGNPVVDGTRVYFGVDRNVGVIQSPAVTLQGKATTRFTYPESEGGSEVVVECHSEGVHDVILLNLPGFSGRVMDVKLSATSTSILGNGEDETEITALVKDSHGNPAGDILVTFATTAGDINASAITDEGSGIARVQLTSSAVEEDVVASVRASSGEREDSLRVRFRGVTLEVVPEKDMISTGGESLPVTVMLKETTNHTPLVGVPLRFGTSLGTIVGTTTTDASGVARNLLVSGNKAGTAHLTVFYGPEIQKTVEVQIVKVEPRGIRITADPTVLQANGTSTSTITVLLRDRNNNPIPDRTVQFSTTLGTVDAEGVTDGDGQAVAVLRSDRTNGSAVVTAGTGDLVDSTVVLLSGVVLEMRANPQHLIADGQTGSVVTVSLRDAAGTPIAGETVHLSTDLGVLDRSAGITDVYGRVTATLRSGGSGTATVRAEGAGATGSVGVSFMDYVFSVSAEPPGFAANVESVTLRARLLDSSRQPVEGVPVTFSTTLGRIQGGGGTTDASGRAEAILTSTQSGAALVTAVAETERGKVSSTVKVAISSAPPASMLLQVDPSIIAVHGGSAAVTAIVTDERGNPVADALVGFTFHGARGGARLDPGTAMTDANGVAKTVFYSGSLASRQVGEVSVEARIEGAAGFGGVTSDRVNLTISGAPAKLTVGYTPSPSANGDGTFDIPVAALVADINGNPVVDGTRVYFGVDWNVGVIQSPVTTDRGRATTRFTYPESAAGDTVEIQSQAGGVRDILAITLPGFSGAVAKVTLSASRTSILGNGEDETEITALVTDTRGNPVGDIVVTFTSTEGRIEESAVTEPQYTETFYGTMNPDWGMARVRLTSSAAEEDVVASIRAVSGSKESDPLEVRFRGVSLEVVPEQGTMNAGGESLPVTVMLKETTSRMPLVGVPLRFGTSLGTIVGTTTTDASGVARNVLVSGNEIGTARLTVFYGPEIQKTAEVQVVEMVPTGIRITADPTVLQANGMSTSTITVLLRDQNHNPISDRTVQLSTTLGTIPASVVTDQDGQASAVLHSDRANGRAVVTARYGSLVDSTVVLLSGVVLEMRAHPEHLIADGQTGSVVTVSLKDAAGTPISGETIHLSADRGVLDRWVGVTDVYGTVTTTLTSEESGTATVQAEGAGATGSVDIAFTDYVFSVSAEPAGFVANESTTLRATLLSNNGQPVQEVPVTFSTTLGRIQRGGGTTDASGRAEAVLTSTQSGTALVTAVAETEGGKVSSTVEVPISSASPASILLQADPSIIAVDGGSAEVTAIVTDEDGNPVTDALVSFSFDGARGGARLDPGTAMTDANGVAKTVFYSGSLASRQLGEVSIEARIEGTGVTSDRVNLTISGAPAKLTVGYTPSPSANGDGTFDIPVAALVADINGNPVVDGTRVYFGVDVNVGVIQSPVTTSQGRATTRFTYPESAAGDTVEIRSQAGGVRDALPIMLPGFSGTVAEVKLSASRTSILGNGEDETEITALVTDTRGNPVGDIVVTFTSTEGRIEESAVTEPQYTETFYGTMNPDWGMARVRLTSSAAEEDVVASIRAVSGSKESDPLGVRFRGVSLEVVPEKDVISTGGEGLPVTVVLKETTSHTPLIGVPLQFGVSLGTIVGTATTDASGVARNVLVSGNEAGTARLTVFYGPRMQKTVEIRIVEMVPRGIRITADPTVLQANGTSTSTITVLLRDRSNNPVPDRTVQFSTTLGTVDAEGVTDRDGRVMVHLTSERRNGSAVVTAGTGDLADSTVVLLSGVVLEMRANPEHLIADGQTGSVVTVSLRDAAGTPIAGETVHLSTNLGVLNRPVGITDVYGTVTTTLTSEGSGKATVQAEGAGAAGSATVSFTDYLFSVSAEPSGFAAEESTALRATLLDNSRRPVEGVPVTFSTTLGWIQGGSGMTDASGRAEAVLRSTQSGTALVTVVAETEGGKVSSTVDVPISSASPASILLQVDPSIIAVDRGTAEATAIVTDGRENPVADALVSFTFDGARGGAHLETGTALTDANGVAKVAFYSGSLASTRPGDVSLEAHIEGTEVASNRVSLTISGAPAKLTVGYMPSPSDHKDGTFEIPIAALVADINGNPVVDGTRVYFGVDRNVGVIQSPVPTAQGRATTQFTYPASEAGRRVLMESQSEGVRDSMWVTLPGFSGTVAEVLLSATRTSILADGVDGTTMRAFVTDTEGNPVGDILVTFTSTEGQIEESAVTGTQYIYTPAGERIVNPNWGVAEVRLTSTAGAHDRITSVQAFSGDRESDPVQVYFRGVTLEVAAEGDVLGAGGESLPVTVTLKETTSHMPLMGARLDFGTSLGTIVGTTTTDASGVGRNLLVSGNETGTATLIVRYGATVEDTVFVEIVEIVPRGIQITVDPTVLQANGTSTSTITVLLRDRNNNPIPDRTVQFSTTLGTVDAEGVTDGNGRALAYLTSERRNGTAVVTARYGTLEERAEVQFSGVTLDVRAEPENLIADGTALSVIRATLKDAAGSPIAGETVGFSTLLGSLNAGGGVTDVNGVATDTLTSSEAGEAEVQAEGAGVEGTVKVRFTDYVFSLEADPAGFAANVGSSTITATLSDHTGTPVQDVRVDFSTTLGWLSPRRGTTDAAGRVHTVLTGTGAGMATVVATAVIGDGETVSKTIEVSISSALPTAITVVASPTITPVDGGTSSIMAVVTDAGHNPVSGATVSFTIAAGPHGGEILSPATVTTNASGVARTGFTSGFKPSVSFGDVKIVARVVGTGVESDSLALTIAGAPQRVTVGYTAPPEDNRDGTYSLSVAAIVSDINGNPAVDGTLVYFGTAPSTGVITSPVGTKEGIATTTLMYPANNAGSSIRISAESGGISDFVDLILPGSSGVAADVKVSVTPGRILGDGLTTAELSALVIDALGNPVGGLSVDFFAEHGAIVQGEGVTGFSWGTVRATLISAPTEAEEGLVDSVWAVAGDRVSRKVPVVYAGVSMEVSVDPPVIAAGGEQATVTVVLKEAETTVPLEGAEVGFGTSLGSIVRTATTDASGVAQSALVSGDASGTATVTVTYGPGIRRTLPVEIAAERGEDPASIVLVSAEPATIGVKGSGDNETATIVFEVTDAHGIKVQDGTPILFTLAGGIAASLSPMSPDTAWTVDGRVSATLQSGSWAGTVKVVATSADFPGVSSGAVSVAVHGGPPDADHFSLAADKLNIAGKRFSGLEDPITAYVFDQYSNPVPVGTSISFQTTGGGIEGSAVTDENGRATVKLISAKPWPEDGLVTVSAQTVGRDTLGLEGPIEATIQVLFSGPTAPILVDPPYITVPDGGRQAFVFFVGDGSGHPLVEGTTIRVTATGGSVTGDVDVTLPDTQSPEATLYGFIFEDHEGDDTSPQVKIKVTSENGDREAVITTGPPSPRSVELIADGGTVLADGVSTVTLTATVVDMAGYPIPGQAVAFTTDLGSVPAFTDTDADGRAEAVWTSIPSTTDRSANVIAQVDDLTDTLTITLKGVTLTVDTAAPTVLADGVSTVDVIAQYAETTTNAPIVGQTIRFAAFDDQDGDGMQDAGEETVGVIGSSGVTDESGQARVAFTGEARSVDQSVRIRAMVGGLSDTTRVDLLGVTLSVAASPAQILANGTDQAAVTARLTESASGTPIQGKTIQFASTLGTLSGGTGVTNASGEATVVLTGGVASGTATVTAAYGMSVVGSVDLEVISAEPDTVQVEADDEAILGDGVSTTTITATVLDAEGLPVSGVEVEFEADAGTLSPPSARTDAEGRATATLTSAAVIVEEVTATVTVRAGSVEEEVAVVFAGVQLTLSATPTTIIADGISPSTITAVLKERANNIVIPGATVFFATDVGTITREAITDEQGVAQVLLISVPSPDTATVSAFYGKIPESTVSVVFEVSTPEDIALLVTPTVLVADRQSTAEMTVTVTDQNGTLVPDGTVVQFDLDPPEGTLLSGWASTVDGMALNTLTSGDTPGTVTLRAWIQGDSAATVKETEITYAVGPAETVTVSADSTELPADGFTSTTVRATVKDMVGNPVPNVEVAFASSIGNVTASASTDTNGVATARFSSDVTGTAIVTATVAGVSGTSPPIFVRPGPPHRILLSYTPTFVGVRGVGRNSTLTVTAEVYDAHGNTVQDSTLVAFRIVASPSKPGDVYRDMLSTTDPVPTVNGIARVAFTSGSRSGTARIGVQVDDIEAVSTEIQVFSGPPHIEDPADSSSSHLAIGAGPINILGWHVVNNRTTITVVVGDKYNNPVPEGTAVYFTTTGGVVAPATGYVDAEGVATVTLITGAPFPTVERYGTLLDPNRDEYIGGAPWDFDGGGPNDGIARVLATSEGADSTGASAAAWGICNVVFSGAVDSVSFEKEDALVDTLWIGESAGMTIWISDVNGNPIVSGSTLTAETTAGALSWTTLTTGDPGQVQYYLALGNDLTPREAGAEREIKPGIVTVKLESPNGSGLVGTVVYMLVNEEP